ncbi:MAG: phenylalanine--tRNA ligase subunit beta [Dokdonella sp.]
MKFSEKWLRELVELKVDHDTLLKRLNLTGLEVESVEKLGAGLDRIVVGEIVSADPHPDADKLRICQVSVGSGENLQIVCGAPNARVGLKAPLAQVGATVGTLTIAAAKLRGVESNGMLCSAKELGLDSDANGLLELAADARAGVLLRDYLGLPDSAIELGLTPNRSDCLGMRGLAREIAAQFATHTTLPDVAPVTATHDAGPTIRVDAPADCPRYCGRLIRGVAGNAVAPLWLRERLRRSGVRSISALVDVTNYVMLETGQPLHAFDAAKIDGSIVVRRARADETLKLLDERLAALTDHMLVIADESKPIALAGVMGGFDTRVTSTTTDVILESAHFAPAAIAGRARKLGLHTDASHRFERGVDPELPRLALERATALLIEIAGGHAGPVVESVAAEHLPPRNPVTLRRSRIKRVLGIAIDDAKVEAILRSLGLQVQATSDGWTATPPSARFDIAIEEDLIEEVARIHGYDQIPTRDPAGEIHVAVVHEDVVATRTLRDQLIARDYNEAISYAFIGATQLEQWGLSHGSIALTNPLSADLGVMRTSILPGLVSALAANCNRQQDRVRLFEIGRAYRHGEAAPIETPRIAAAAIGSAQAEQWGVASRELDIFDIKGDIESLLQMTGTSASEFATHAGGPVWLHPGRAATLMRGAVVVGYYGSLHPQLLKQLDLDDDVYVFEFDLETLTRRRLPEARNLSKFPSVRRDIAVLLPEDVAYADVEACLRDAVGEQLAQVFLFDRYVGTNLPSGMKSIAIGLILQDLSRTLTDQDSDRCMGQAIAALGRGFGATLRG